MRRYHVTRTSTAAPSGASRVIGGDGARLAPPPRPRGRLGAAAQHRIAAWLFLLPLLAYLLAFYAYPMYKNIDLSTHNYTVRSFVYGGAPFTGWANYRTVIHDPTFMPALEHTLVFTFISIVFQFGIGLAL